MAKPNQPARSGAELPERDTAGRGPVPARGTFLGTNEITLGEVPFVPSYDPKATPTERRVYRRQ